MKRKFILFGALILLLAGISFMAWDMFFNKPDSRLNPYAYDLNSLKSGDTSQILYAEVHQFTPGLHTIHGIAVDQSDRIYICGENGVEIFNSSGKLESEFTIPGTANCIHVDQDGMIYLGMQDHLETYDKTGKHMKRWKSCGKDAVITSIAVTGSDVFIADAGGKVVYQYDLEGNLVKKIGEKDPVRNIPGFVIPSPYFDLGIGNDGDLWVVNPGRHFFEKYNSDGDLITTWGASSMTMEGFCGCCNPSNFAMLSNGSFVTSEKGIERIKVYGPEGDFKSVVAGPDAFIEGTSGLDLAVNSQDQILALDPEKKQVRFFELKKPEK
ncbi:MAG: hypothetical protein Q8M08_11195 [Bacteroidales bacterium]|nr:hypothetical protein [Bacteroidales bacterium]